MNTSLDSGVPFVSLDGVTGTTVAPRDSAALSEALTRLLDDSELRAIYAVQARDRVATEFTVELMTRRILHLYDTVISDKAVTRIDVVPA